MLFVEIAVVVALTLVNGVLAMSELGVVSARKARLEGMAADGSRGARAALRLKEDPSRFLSTVQIGITLVGIFAGAFSGATLADRLGHVLSAIPAISENGHTIAFVVVVVSITYLSLVAGELVPKRLALANPEAIAVAVAPAMTLLSRVAAPMVWLLKSSTEAALALLGQRSERDETVSEEEIRAMIAEGTATGVFEAQEREMIEGVLRLADRSVRALMTPRSEIVWLDREATRDEIARTVTESRFSRLLVCEGTVDEAVGVVHTKALLGAALGGAPLDLETLMMPLVAVPDRTPVLTLIEHFRRGGTHMVVIVDEYGTTEGIVTPTDVLETIAGDLPGHGEAEEPDMVAREDGSWLVDGLTPLDEFRDRLAVRGLEEAAGYHTVAGLALDRLGHIPVSGEHFTHAGYRFEVVDMDGRRIDKLLVQPAVTVEET
jgi:putative hemolysin